MRVLRWVGIGLGGILLLAVLAALLLPALVNLERYRAILANRAGKALGREVTLGALRVSLWGGIGAEAKGIQIAQAAGFGSQPFLAADALQVRVQLLPLLRGQVKVSKAVLERPRIRLTHARDGRWSVDDLLKPHPAPPPTKPAPDAARPGKAPLLGGLLLSEVAVKGGEITLQDEARAPGITLTLTDLDLSLRQRAVSDPLEIRSRARIGPAGAGRIETTGRIAVGDPESPILDVTVTLRDVDVGPWQTFLMHGGGTKFTGPFSGELRLTGPVAQAAFTGGLNLNPVAIQAGEAFRKAAGEEASLSFEGRREDQGLNLSKVILTLKETTVNGSLRVPDLKTPRVTFTATSPKVDLDRLLAKPVPNSAPKKAWLGTPLAHAAVPSRPGGKASTAGPGLTAQGQVSIGDLRYQGLTWTAVQAEVRYQDGLVQLPEVRANFLNGKVTAKGEVDLRPRTPRISLTSRFDNLATEPLVQALIHGPWTLRSALSFDSSLNFVGFSLPEILGSAAGGGSVLLKEGRLIGYKPLDRLSEVIAPILVSQGSRVRLNEFEQVSGRYTLDKGVLRTRDLTLTKTEGSVTAAGSLGLLDSSLDFDVVAKLGRTTVEAKVTGTTSQPIVVPKLGRLQRKIETELDKVLPGEQGKGLKDLFKGLFGR
ncbi:MAG: AsmA family protein [candidate division NC10 bacterium]|nr:AsmA family protein [candidate division NC10 bacterium]